MKLDRDLHLPHSAAAWVVAIALTATACTGGGHPSPAPTETALAGGGTLRVGVVQVFGRDYDPQVYTGTPWFGELGRCCLLRTLLSYNGRDTSDGGTVLRPDLAASLPDISPDGLTWTFRLKPGIHYAPPFAHTEIVAEDFIRSIERDIAPAPPYLLFFGGLMAGSGGAGVVPLIQGAKEYSDGRTDTITGLDAPDDHTLVVHLTEPNGVLGYQLAATETAPIPASPLDPGARFGVADGHDGDYGNFLVASGPYMIEGADRLDFRRAPVDQAPAEGIRPDSLTLVRNPSWDPTTDGLRQASPDRIVFTQLDPDRGAREIARGTIDVGIDWDAPPAVVGQYQASPQLSRRVYETPADSVLFMQLNIAVPPLDDVHVRKAMTYAFDKDAALGAFEQDRDLVADLATHIAPDSLEHDLLLHYDPYGPDHEGNLASAREEMRASKYDTNGDGICDADACRDVRLLVRESKPERVAIATIARKDFARIGVHLQVDVVDDGTFFSTFNDPFSRAPLILFESNRGVPAASAFLGAFVGGSPIDSGGSLVGVSPQYLRKYGYSVTSVPSVDDRIEECRPKLFEEGVACWAGLDQYLMEHIVPWIPIAATSVPRIVSARVQGFSFDQANPDVPQPALDRITLTPSAAAEPPPHEPSPTATSGAVSAIPDGTYTAKVTDQDFVRAGVDPNDEGDLTQNSGTYAVTLSQGRWRSTLTSPDVWWSPVATGIYYGSGDRVTFVTQTPQVNVITVTLEWHVRGTGLRFTVTDAPKDALPWVRGMYESHPWTSVG
jgi:peptide/nickel transport system substrate-binding protein